MAFQRRSGGTQRIFVTDGARTECVFAGVGLGFIEWRPFSRELVVAQDSSGVGRERLLLVDLHGRSQVLLDDTGEQRRFGGMSRDGRRMVFGAIPPGERGMRLYTFDFHTRSRRLIPATVANAVPGGWHPDGRSVVLTSPRGERANALLLCDSRTGESRPLFDPSVPSACRHVGWADEGRSLYVLSDHHREYIGLASLDIGSGSLKFLQTPECDIEAFAMPWTEEYISWIENWAGVSILRVRSRDGADVPAPPLPRGVVSVSWARRSAVAAVFVSGAETRGDLFRWTPDGSVLHTLQRVASSPRPRGGGGCPELVELTAQDGYRIHAWRYAPQSCVTAVMIHLHGGPTAQARPTPNAMRDAWLRRGRAVVDVNYRGSAGFGRSYANSNDGLQRHKELWDVEAARAWVAARYPRVPIVLCGHSYGGYLALASLAASPQHYAAAVSMSGISDWLSALSNTSELLAGSDAAEYGNLSDAAIAAMLRRLSPLQNVERLRAPVLLVHGTADLVVPVHQSDALWPRLRAASPRSQYLRLPGIGHRYSEVEERKVIRAMERFLDRAIATPGTLAS